MQKQVVLFDVGMPYQALDTLDGFASNLEKVTKVLREEVNDPYVMVQIQPDGWHIYSWDEHDCHNMPPQLKMKANEMGIGNFVLPNEVIQ